MSNTSSNKTSKTNKQTVKVIVGEIGRDTKTGILGRGYSYDNGATFHVTDTMFGRLYDKDDGERMWPNMAHKVADEIKSATADLPNVRKQADKAVKFAESAIAASKVNSDAIVAQSEAISEAKTAMDSATAEIQQTAANAASDAAKIRADVARVQSEVDTAKAANSASVEALKSDVSAAKQDLADVHDSLTKAQSAIEQNQKLINDSVAKITSDVSATKQDLADVHDSLTKAQTAAEENQKAIDQSIAQINSDVDGTKQGLAGVRKDLTKAQTDITANQKSINDNVAKINADITQDHKDIASAQQANADTAKQLDAYSKQAAAQGKTIKSIQDKQDGFTATLADVQGNVSQVSDKVDGLSANLKDAQGNVASVKAQADQLSATLTDHGKAIATLTASAKELSSTLEDADGRLSKVEQTAQTNSSTLSDVQGDLSQVKQNATKLVSTLKDAQGNISTLQQKADSVSAQLASAQGDIATLQTGVDSVKATLASHDKTIHTLQLDSKSLKDSMADAQGDISTLSKTATSLDSEMKDHAGRLSKVEQNATTQATTLSDLQGNLSQVKQQADGLVTTLKDAQGSITQIQQKADGTLAQLKSAQSDIASLQMDVTGIKDTLTSHEGDIHTLQADSKTLKDNMADAQGNISSLQKSSTKLNSEFSSQDGRLSKVEQTAKEHTSTISDLGKKVDSNGGGVNLISGTIEDIVVDDTANTGTQGWCFNTIPINADLKVGDKITVSVENVTMTGKGDLSKWGATLYSKDISEMRANNYEVNAGKNSQVTITVTSMNDPNKQTALLIYSGRVSDTEGKKAVFHHLKVERGEIATPYSPAPEDLATVTQVKQTADGIETTLKSAQGDIDQIKQTAKGTSEQLSNVQGDVTNIQKDVNGLKQTTADNAGNIHTLQSDSKALQDDMKDAKGNISSLQKTSTSLVSEFRDHDGRLSKVEQTATEHTSELADAKGNIDKVTQKANALQLLLSDAQKNIQNIQLDAKGLHDTLTGQNNQLANLYVTLNNLDSKYSGITGDLQSKQTALSTEQQQTKDMLLNKADKSEVDNVKGTVNQVSAKQKVMADQINQKVSSTEYKMLKDKVNEMNGGGKNLLKGTRDFDSKYWYCSDSNHSALEDNPVDSSVKEIHSYGDWASFRYNQTIQLDPNKNYMISADIAIYGNDGNGLYITAYGNLDGVARGLTNDVNLAGFPKQQNGEGFKRVYLPLNTHGKKLDTFRIEGHGNWYAGEGSVFISKIALYEGNTQQGWEDSSDDLIESIQKNATAIDQTNKQISLKADQTEVDEIKGTASQNSSRIDVMNNEINSKVSSTDVNNILDSKGYATTSTVQSLITQKAGTINESITNLTNSFNNFQVGGRNYLQNSDKSITGWAQDLGTIPNEVLNELAGKTITVSCDVEWDNFKSDSSKQNRLGFEAAVTGSDGKGYWLGAWKYPTTSNGKERISAQWSLPAGVTFTANNNSANGYVSINGSGKVSHVKIEIGNRMTDWSPAPEDTTTQIQSLTASIDGLQSTVANKADKSQITQLSNVIQSKVSSSDFNDLKDKTLWKSTDSIDLNTAVSQQKIFVKGGSNLPPGLYWWYVQVEPGYDSRIVQYAVSDRDNIHYSRQYDGSKWSAWSQGATESEITQLRDDINLRVKSGDLLSQINLTAGNTLIQSNKLYLDASSVVITGTAFIPSAAIASLSADKINTGTLNTDKISLSNGHVRLSSDDDHFYVQTEENAVNNPTTRFSFDGIDFMDNSYGPDVVQYSIGYDTSSADRHLRISAFDHFNSGGASATQGYTSMVDAISLNSREVNFAANGNMHMQVVDGGVNIKPTLFFQNNTNNGTFAGFNRLDNSNTVEFNTGDNDGENFHVNSGARFMQYVYINGYARAQGWLTNSTLSKKTNIRKLDTQVALDKIRQDDQYLYEYKRNVAQGIYDPQASFIIDDVNDVSHYSVPREFIDQSGNYREPNVELAYLIAAFQAIDKQVQLQQAEIKELKEKLQHE